MPHVTFIHGICNKPPKDQLRRSWLSALRDDDGVDLDYQRVSSSMVYWADLMYASPLSVATGEEAFESVDLVGAQDSDLAWLGQADPDEAALMARLAARIGLATATAAPLPPPDPVVDASLELLPPTLAAKVMKTFLRDVHHYLFNTDFSPRPGEHYNIQDTIRGRVLDALAEGASKSPPHIAVTHSMGTVIIYDCLMRVPDCPPVDGLMTVGSPLGVDEIQHCLKPQWSRRDGFPTAHLNGPWVNVFDRLDVVAAADPAIANDFQSAGRNMISDISEANWGRWRHDIGKYLRGPQLRAEVAKLLDLVAS